MPFQRILVATDLSSNSVIATAYAKSLAKAGRDVRLVHVLPAPLRIPLLGRQEKDRLQQAFAKQEAEAERRLGELKQEAGLSEAETDVRNGSVSGEVVASAEAFGADLIVIAAHSRRLVERLVLGSKARAIVRAAPTPVLVVRGTQPSEATPFQRIAVATDFYEAAEHAGEVALDLAQAHDAELLAAHALHPDIWAGIAMPADPTAGPGAVQPVEPTWLEDTIKGMLHDYNEKVLHGSAREVMRAGQPVDTISTIARDEEVDLLVVGTHGPGTLERALIGSVAEGIADRAPCSVLVVRNG